MKTLKKILGVSLVFFSFSNLFAQEQDFNFSCRFDTGILNGSIKEFVFDFDENGDSYILSQLDWDFQKIFYYGLHSDISCNHLHIDTQFKIGTNGICGTMDDYDWQDKSDISKLTNHSWHTNSLDTFTKVSLNAGWNFFLPAKITLTPLLGFESENISFLGSDGAYKYLNSDGVTFNTGSFKGKVISYNQKYNTLKLGFYSDIKALPFVDFDLSFFVCPLFKINGYDHHFARSIYFWDKMEKGVMFEGECDIAFNFLNNKLSAGINGGFQCIPIMCGKTYTRGSETKKWVYSYSLGGTQRLLWQLGCYFKVLL